MKTSNLPTEEEFNNDLTKHRKTAIGFIFPFLPKEYLRVFLYSITFTLIAFIYCTMRTTRNVILYKDLCKSCKTWLDIFSFLSSFIFIKILNYAFDKYGVYKGLINFNILCVVILLVNSVVIFLEKFLIRKYSAGVFETIFLNSAVVIRRLDFLNPVNIILLNFPISFFYLLSDAVHSVLIFIFFLQIGRAVFM